MYKLTFNRGEFSNREFDTTVLDLADFIGVFLLGNYTRSITFDFHYLEIGEGAIIDQATIEVILQIEDTPLTFQSLLAYPMGVRAQLGMGKNQAEALGLTQQNISKKLAHFLRLQIDQHPKYKWLLENEAQSIERAMKGVVGSRRIAHPRFDYQNPS